MSDKYPPVFDSDSEEDEQVEKPRTNPSESTIYPSVFDSDSDSESQHDDSEDSDWEKSKHRKDTRSTTLTDDPPVPGCPAKPKTQTQRIQPPVSLLTLALKRQQQLNKRNPPLPLVLPAKERNPPSLLTQGLEILRQAPTTSLLRQASAPPPQQNLTTYQQRTRNLKSTAIRWADQQPIPIRNQQWQLQQALAARFNQNNNNPPVRLPLESGLDREMQPANRKQALDFAVLRTSLHRDRTTLPQAGPMRNPFPPHNNTTTNNNNNTNGEEVVVVPRDREWACCNCGAGNSRYEFLCWACAAHSRGDGGGPDGHCCATLDPDGPEGTWAGQLVGEGRDIPPSC
ncbi:hypothetical protein N656DRAFT_841392 [Canariomyces notabilis]|uniref:Uncharacterized protein n=1 Tax=Canariomyces notabilis TaxID=2074819 RepID=A0AAN6TNL5_9PEZI|nr:hypothetical protein N656DRAFT_841392 [Canariomyces arenarius]